MLTACFPLPIASLTFPQSVSSYGSFTCEPGQPLLSLKTPLQAHELMYLQLGGTQFHNDLGIPYECFAYPQGGTVVFLALPPP